MAAPTQVIAFKVRKSVNDEVRSMARAEDVTAAVVYRRLIRIGLQHATQDRHNHPDEAA